jgi:hypothetical protein
MGRREEQENTAPRPLGPKGSLIPENATQRRHWRESQARLKDEPAVTPEEVKGWP